LLLVASYAFYLSWNAAFTILLLATTLLDYALALQLGKATQRWKRRLLLAISLSCNLGLLVLFKYANFLIDVTGSVFDLVGVPFQPSHLDLFVLIGVSFHTFQTLSYTIDVYRKEIQPVRSWLDFATYVAFFPQLVAGPIVRAKDFLPQFERTPRLDATRAGEALFYILRGLGKKILIADYIGRNLVQRVFDDPATFSSAHVWIAVYAFTWQLYCDFSGYTDIARGSAMLFDFDLPDNFQRPMTATGPIEHWRRWHMSLSSWFRDYVYIPLGGSRTGPVRTYANVFIVFLLMGIWHGAGWPFVCFGVWHALGVVANRAYRDVRGRKRTEPLGWRKAGLVFLQVSFWSLSWPMFWTQGQTDRMLEMYGRMFAFEGSEVVAPPLVWPVLLGVVIMHYTPARWMDELRAFAARRPVAVQAAFAIAAAALMTYVSSDTPAPFAYIQF